VLARKFSPNQTVGLQDDVGFVGVVTGALVDRMNTFTGKWVIGVKEPGKSAFRGQAHIEEGLLVALNAPPAYVPPPRGVSKARALAPGHAPAEQISR